MSTATLLPSSLLPSYLLGGAREQGPVVATQVSLGPVGHCPHVPTLTIFVFDNSGSVSGVFGNDPVARRFDEARLAIHTVSRRCRCDHERVSVVHFDSPTCCDVPPTRLGRNGWRRVEHGLAIPSDGAGSSILGPSLQAAHRLAETYADHNAVAVVLSDFQLFDDDLPGLYSDLASFPGTVHAVSLRATPPQQLVDDERVVVTHITYDAERGALAQAVLTALTTQRLP